MDLPFNRAGICWMSVVLFTLACGLFAGCGGGGGGGNDGDGGGGDVQFGCIDSGSGDSLTIQMGGSRQGSPLDLTGVVSTFAGATDLALDGLGAEAVFLSPKGVTTDGTYLYVADTSNQKIRRIEISTGAVTTLAGSGVEGSTDGAGTAASFLYPQGIIGDGLFLYVADTFNHTIRRIDIVSGNVSTFAGSGAQGSTDGVGASATFSNPKGIVTDGTYLYVVDSSNSNIRRIEITTGIVTTLAGTGTPGATDGTGTAASFNIPSGMASDGTNLYVADTRNHTIRRIEIATGVVTTFAGSAGIFGSVDGTGAAARFYSPARVTTDGVYLYVTDAGTKIRRIEIVSGIVTTFAGSDAYGSMDGAGVSASFSLPVGITTDGTYLYVADSSNHKIRRINIATSVVTSVAGSAMLDGVGTSARFQRPASITTDGTYLYAVDYLNHNIRCIKIATGEVTTLAGSMSISGSVDGTGTAASFYLPGGVTTDGSYLYVADTHAHTIRRIDIATGVVTTLAGSGNAGSADGTRTAASFDFPQDITTDGNDLYVADRVNNKIRRVEIATGEVTTFAGSGSLGMSDGIGTAASFNRPFGITTDGVDLYVADRDNHSIRVIDIATGEVSTLAGTGVPGSMDGTGTAASFNKPRYITTDGTNLYVADTDNLTVRRIEITTGVVTTLAGSGTPGSIDGVGTAASFRLPSGVTTDGKDLYVTDSVTGSVRRIL